MKLRQVLLQVLMPMNKNDEVLTKIEGMRLSAQSNHIPLELQQILEDCFVFFFKLDSLICYQPLHSISLTLFLILSLPLCCADWALCSVPHMMPAEQH